MVLVDKSYQRLAYHYIGGQIKKLQREIDGARQAKDIEHIHQSRVASRRLRSALGVFENCFDIKKVKKWRKEIKRLTKSLGPARDADVQIEFLNKVISELDEKETKLHPGIERLLLRIIQNRQTFQNKVIKTIDRLESRAIIADIHSAIEKIMFYLRNENPDVKSKDTFQTTSQHISSKLQELLSHQECLKDHLDKQGHHQLRIAAKRLRYTMEICREPYNGRLNNVIKVAQKLQTLLGDIHDCDVWCNHIDKFLEEELQRTEEYFGYDKPYYLLLPGLEYLQQKLRQKRQQFFEELLVYWKKLCDEKTWDKLISKLKEPLTDSAQPSIVEIKERASNEAKIQENTADRGCPCESAGIKSCSQ